MTDKFILKATKLYGNKYDYSKVFYINSHTKVNIICPKHGEFEKSHSNFFKGQECKQCSERKPHPKNKTIEQFIEEATKIFSDTYDYSKVSFKKMRDKITVICKKHGEFETTPMYLLGGRRCSYCGNEVIGQKLRGTFDDFVKCSKEKHGEKYQYIKPTEYSGQYTLISIICPVHGIFNQTTKVHMRGSGCPKCSGVDRRSADEVADDFKLTHGNK